MRSAETDLWSKLALPFSALVFTVIGAPLGLRPQRSSKITGWFLAILIIFGYYVLYTTMGYAARGGGLPPILAAFLPDIIGLALGGALVWRALDHEPDAMLLFCSRAAGCRRGHRVCR